MGIFWGHHKIGPVLEVISMYLGSFMLNVQNGDIFWGLQKFQIFFGGV